MLQLSKLMLALRNIQNPSTSQITDLLHHTRRLSFILHASRKRDSAMIPSMTLLRTARILFPLRPASVPTARCFSALTAPTGSAARRPMMLAASREVQKSISEQVRGMKVRSSVKKLCEGCKVRLDVSSSISAEMAIGSREFLGCFGGVGLMQMRLIYEFYME